MSDENIEDAIRPSILFPLTKRTRMAFEYREKLEKEWENKENCDTLHSQGKAMDTIKRFIAMRKREYLCHHKERMDRKKRQQEELENKVLDKYKLDLKNVEIRNKIAQKLIAHQKEQQAKATNRKKRMLQIVQKLMSEFQEKEQIGVGKPKFEIKRRLKYEEIQEVSVVSEPEEEWEEETPEEKQEVKGKKAKRPKKAKKEKAQKGKKKSKKKKSKKKRKGSDKTKSKKKKKKSKKGSVKSKKGKRKKHEDFVLPDVPITNPRLKPEPENILKESDFQQCLDIHKDLTKFYAPVLSTLPIEHQFSAKPSPILFKDFENDRVYKEHVKVSNNSAETIHCQFKTLTADDEFSLTSIEIEPFPVQKLLPGLSFTFFVVFRPQDMRKFNGTIILITKRIQTNQSISKFEIPFACEIEQINIEIKPTNVRFKSLPFWELGKNNRKNYANIKIENKMLHNCLVVVRKIPTSFEDHNTEELKQTVDKENSLNIIQDLIDECIENVYKCFFIEYYWFPVEAKQIFELKVYFRNAPFIGIHQELYEFEIIQNRNNEFQTLMQEQVLIQAETTGKFITTDTNYLDFRTCVFDSVYRETFYISNEATFPVKIGFQFPTKLRQYFSVYPATFYLKPNQNEIFSELFALQFIPRISILDSNSKYYDFDTGILSFPMKICLLSKKHKDIPPTVLTVYAILTEPDAICLKPLDQDFETDENGFPIIDLGLVTTHETVTAEFQIKNMSIVLQDFGFLNLPLHTTITPEYGFGSLSPNEVKTLKLHFSPTVWDMIDKVSKEPLNPYTISYQIKCCTVRKLGGLPESNIPTDKQSVSDIFDPNLYPSLFKMDEEQEEEMYEVRDDLAPFDYNTQVEADSQQEEESQTCVRTLSIVVRATIVDYWTELSHQFVQFPDTPVGSYTTIGIIFSAQNHSTTSACVCGYTKHIKPPNFQCHFEVVGGCEEITIEPICGNLKQGEAQHILLIARPTIEQQLLEQTAKVHKALKSAKKTKKKTKSASTNVSNFNPDVSDYYTVEKEIWKNITTRTITTNFTFTVTFETNINKSMEILYLTAECKVVRPQFITDLATQCLNFGPTAITTRPKTIITVQNISKKKIHPKVSPVSPVGPFACAILEGSVLEMEHLLKVPVTFAPTQEIKYREYFEIKSGNTIETLVATGEGVLPNFDILPKFTICRIEAKYGKHADCNFVVQNKCKAPLQIKLKKVCELKGKMLVKPLTKEEKKAGKKQDKQKKAKGKSKSDKTSKKSKGDKASKKTKGGKASKKSKSKKMKKFSDNLTPDEEYSIENSFEVFTDESQFKVVASKDDIITATPFSKTKIKIRFKTPKPPKEATPKKIRGKKDKSKSPASKTSKATKKAKKSDIGSKATKKAKKSGVASKGTKGSKKSSKTSKSSKGLKKEKGVKYVAKYNAMLGGLQLIKDFIIIAQFK